jgi:hypothetical protein
MKWIRRFKKQKDGIRNHINPKESGDYWVTDGYYVHMAHYIKESNSWGIYRSDKFHVIKYCYSLSDMNFNIVAYCEVKFPKNYTKFAE